MSFSSPSSEEPPLKKNKKAFQQTTISSLDSLPYDLLLSCLARVSRLYYPILSLVSKKFRSLLISPELYKARSLLLLTETCLYVCLRFHHDSNPLWFTLCKKPNRNDTATKKTTQKNKNSSGYVLATIPIPHSHHHVHSKGLVTVGSNIYTIGESNHLAPPSSRVSIIDCRSHTWHEAPNMQVERRFADANVFDGKIYVAGGCDRDNDSSKWMEVFDPKTKTWETVLCPVRKICENQIGMSAVFEGQVNLLLRNDDIVLAYNPKEDKWVKSPAKWGTSGGMGLVELNYKLCSYCVIGKVLYCYDYLEGIRWYDSKVKQWVDLLSLDELPKFYKYSRVQLCCYGRKMVVLWDRNLPCSASGGSGKTIWCAVIALKKRKKKKEIWGIVESIDDDVLTVPSSYEFVSALSVTV